MPAIFISHSSKDRQVSGDIKAALTRLGFEQAFLDFDKETGLDIGENWEKRLYEELTRCHAVVLVLTPAWLASKWCFAELTQARALGKVILPVLCELVEGRLVLPDIQAVDLVDWNAGGLERLERRLRAISDELARGFALDPTRPPYPGINAFQKEDAAIYFGRDEESRAALERLDARRTQGGARFVIIIGASGSGKSSLLKASVLPLLNRRRPQWVLLPDIRPERAPMEALAKALAQHVGQPEGWRDWHEKLNGPDAAMTLERLVQDARIGEARGATVLLPVDQFEECFTTTPATERAAFLRLLQAAFGRDLPFMVIATGRSDVLEGLIESSELVGHYETFPLTAMPLERYPRLIEGPAAVAGITVEKGLSERIGRDVESKEALPLLAHMLALLYQRGLEDKKLSLAEYEALGDSTRGLNPIQNSIRLAADEAITRVKPSERELDALRDAFVPHLVRVRLDDGKRVRQTARRSELPAESLRLIGALTEARLLTTRSSDAEREPLVEVTHEALFKAWPALDQWLTDQQAFLTDLERIRTAHENYANAPNEQKSGELLYGLLLSRARDWLLKYPQRFVSRDMEPLRAYIAASAEVADAERARQQRIRRSVFVGMAAAVVLLTAVAVVAILQYRDAEDSRISAEAARSEAVLAERRASEEKLEAEKQRNRAEEQAKLAIAERNAALITQSRFLIDKSNDVLKDGDHGTALALALEALPDERRGIVRPYLPSAEAALYQAVTTLRELQSFPRPPDGQDGRAVRFSPDGRMFVVFSGLGSTKTPSLRDAVTGAQLFALAGHAELVTALAFSADGEQIATGSTDHTARTWSARDGRPLQTFNGHEGTVWSVAFSPDGKRLLTGASDDTARIWNAKDATAPPQVLKMSDSESSRQEVETALFSPDASRIVTLSRPAPAIRHARIWDAASGNLQKLLDEEDHFAWSDGRYALTVRDSEEAKTHIWDIASGSEIGELPRTYSDDGAAFASDGSIIAVVSRNKLFAWGPAKSPDAPPFLREWDLVDEASKPIVSRDGGRIAAFSGTTLKIWNTREREVEPVVLQRPAGTLAAADFSPDGRRIATLIPDAVRIWDATDLGPVRLLYYAPPTRIADLDVAPAAFSGDGQRVAAVSTDRSFKVWDTASGSLVDSRKPPGPTFTFAILPDGLEIAAVFGTRLLIWNASSDAAPRVLAERPGLGSALAVSADGKRVAAGTADGYALIWETRAGAAPIVSGKFPAHPVSISFAPDGRNVAAVSDGRVFTWNGVQDAAPTPLPDYAKISIATYSPDGKQIALGDEDGNMQLIDAVTHRPVGPAWKAHDKGVGTAAFSADGNRLLTTGEEEIARVWEAGAEIGALRGHSGAVYAGTFSPHGWIVTTSRDRTVRLWPAFDSAQALVDHARAVMPRQLTAQQRKDFFLDAREIQQRQ